MKINFNISPEIDSLLTREWLVTNGLGGYASGTVAGVATRRYHCLLTANLLSPRGRHIMLNNISETVCYAGQEWSLGGTDWSDRGLEIPHINCLKNFHLEFGIPIWRYNFGEIELEKLILMPYRQNTVHLLYRLVKAQGLVKLKLSPEMNIRSQQDAPGDKLPEGGYDILISDGRVEIIAPEMPPLRLCVNEKNGVFKYDSRSIRGIKYRMEELRGSPAVDHLWSPGYFLLELNSGEEAGLAASTESWETIMVLDSAAVLSEDLARRQQLLDSVHPSLHEEPVSQLVLAADQFIIIPVERINEKTRARASGDEVRSIIAGYHWFLDWGRDALISLEGLCLPTGRHVDARNILRNFARYIKSGLMPNKFSEYSYKDVYHTADDSLWFFHALNRYVSITGDHLTLKRFLPILNNIIEEYLRGTRFGIRVDSADGLLLQGDDRFPLTWMDAKMDEWVVTPRHGKAVEVNALWYNALCLLSHWLQGEGQGIRAEELKKLAAQVFKNFNERFWNDETGFLFDVVDGGHGDDPSCRPNQLFAISLPNEILDQARWRPIIEAVRQHLFTPLGLRSLSPQDSNYHPRYQGSRPSRDPAYHQGTVWPWLIGPFIDAWLKVNPGDHAQARHWLDELLKINLGDYCVGSINEVFDGDSPHIPGGCIAQAWSVAEVIRSWVKTAKE